MILRKYGRIAVEFPASVSAAFSGAEGVILDISLTGCRVKSEMQVEKHDRLGLLILVPGYDSPLCINEASIRWVTHEEFGMEFLEMESKDRQRLHEVLEKSARSM